MNCLCGMGINLMCTCARGIIMKTKMWVMASLMIGLVGVPSSWAAGRESLNYDPIRLVFLNDANHQVRYVFSDLDTDGNGVISAGEAKTAGIHKGFVRLDINRDEQVTRQEFRQHRLI